MQKIKFYPIKEKPQYSEEIVLKSEEWGVENQNFLRNDIRLSKENSLFPKVIVGILDNKAVGYYILNSKEMFNITEEREKYYTPWLTDLFIFKEYRSKHLSSQFIENIFKNIKSLGYKNLYLITSLKNYYEKFGFVYIKKASTNFGIWKDQELKLYRKKFL